MAVVSDVAHVQVAVIEDRDRRGLAVKRGAHDIFLFILCSHSGCKDNHTATRIISPGQALSVSVQREPSGHNLMYSTKWCPPNK